MWLDSSSYATLDACPCNRFSLAWAKAYPKPDMTNSASAKALVLLAAELVRSAMTLYRDWKRDRVKQNPAPDVAISNSDSLYKSVEKRVASLEESETAQAKMIVQLAEQAKQLTDLHRSMIRQLNIALGISSLALVICGIVLWISM